MPKSGHICRRLLQDAVSAGELRLHYARDMKEQRQETKVCRLNFDSRNGST